MTAIHPDATLLGMGVGGGTRNGEPTFGGQIGNIIFDTQFEFTGVNILGQ